MKRKLKDKGGLCERRALWMHMVAFWPWLLDIPTLPTPKGDLSCWPPRGFLLLGRKVV